jgi:hypothetical protein
MNFAERSGFSSAEGCMALNAVRELGPQGADAT